MAKNFNPSEFGIDFLSLDFFKLNELLNNNKFNIVTIVKYNIPTLLSKYGR